MEEEKSVLRLGGIAALLKVALTVIPILVILSLLPPFANSEDLLQRILAFRTQLLLLTGLNVLWFVLILLFMLALWRALRKTSPAFALLGSVLGVTGTAVLTLGYAVFYLSDLALAAVYAEAAPQDAMMVVIAREATSTVFLSAFPLGYLLLGVAYFVLGVATLGAPAFGKGFGWVSTVLGVVAVVGMSLIVVSGELVSGIAGGPVSPIAVVGTALGASIAFFVFPLLLGWKLYSLSRVA